MEEYIVDQIFSWYERIEREVLDFSERVPLTIQNENLETPRLISCLMDACGILDSVFRDRINTDPVLVNGKEKRKDECTIIDYAHLHSKVFDLANTRSVMLVSPTRYRQPFEPWKNLDTHEGYAPLSWWQLYNSMKHDMLANIRLGTLGNDLDALCALHQVLARSIPFIPIMIRRRWFSPGGFSLGIVLEAAEKGAIVPQKFIIMTRLFAVPDGFKSSREYPAQFPEKIEHLSPTDYVYRSRFAEFLGKGV